MESIERYPPHLRHARRNRFLKLSGLQRLVFVIMIGTSAAAIGAKTLGQFTLRPMNPFSVFAAVYPGQPESAIQSFPFSCWTGFTNNRGSEKHCSFSPKDGLISNVELSLDRGVIVQSIFTLRASSVQVGDLRTWLESNPEQTYPHLAFFTFDEFMIIAKIGGHSPHASLFDSVWSVTFIERSVLD